MSTPREIAEKKAREIAKQIIDDWNSGDESTIDQRPANPDGPYFQHLEDRITAALTRSEEEKTKLEFQLTEAWLERDQARADLREIRTWVTPVENHLRSELSTLTAKLKASEEEKRIAADALAMVSEDAGELQSSLSTLTARLKEAEELLAESKEEIGHYECCPQEFGDEEQPCTCGNIKIVERIESFLTASTPVEKE